MSTSERSMNDKMEPYLKLRKHILKLYVDKEKALAQGAFCEACYYQDGRWMHFAFSGLLGKLGPLASFAKPWEQMGALCLLKLGLHFLEAWPLSQAQRSFLGPLHLIANGNLSSLKSFICLRHFASTNSLDVGQTWGQLQWGVESGNRAACTEGAVKSAEHRERERGQNMLGWHWRSMGKTCWGGKICVCICRFARQAGRRLQVWNIKKHGEMNWCWVVC